MIVSRLEPSPWIRFWIDAVEPCPTDTMAITAPTPIRMPSAVSTARIRFCHSDRAAERMFSHSSPGSKTLRRLACLPPRRARSPERSTRGPSVACTRSSGSSLTMRPSLNRTSRCA